MRETQLSVRVLHDDVAAQSLAATATAACNIDAAFLEQPTYCALDVAQYVVLLTSFNYVDLFLPGHNFPILIIDGEPSIERAVYAMKQGAFEYFTIEANSDAVAESLRKAITLITSLPVRGAQPAFVGSSSPMQRVARDTVRFGADDAHVLIKAAMGTEADLVAEELHRFSLRNLMTLHRLNCALQEKQIILQTLLGHGRSSTGLTRAARNSTLFLDQLPNLTSKQCTRLFNSLEHSDVRLIVSTTPNNPLNHNPDFRARFGDHVIDLPPLVERVEDIELLAMSILRKHAKAPREFSGEALEVMKTYHWPSNYRELQHVIERAVLLTKSQTIERNALAIEPVEPLQVEQPPEPLDHSLAEYFVSFVTQHEDELSETEIARKLGISRKSLWQRRQRLGIPRRYPRR